MKNAVGACSAKSQTGVSKNWGPLLEVTMIRSAECSNVAHSLVYHPPPTVGTPENCKLGSTIGVPRFFADYFKRGCSGFGKGPLKRVFKQWADTL